jgi:hypothetical protein
LLLFYIGLRYTEGLLASSPAQQGEGLLRKKRSKHAALPAFGDKTKQ